VVAHLAVPSEARLPHAGLWSLVEPLLPHTDGLPEPQAHAIATAFGQVAGGPVEATFLGFAVLNLLREAAAGQGLLLVVDDLQWLDEPSSTVLRFVARRIDRDPILLLASSRQAGFERGVEEVEVDGLEDAAAEALVDRFGGALGPALRHRLIAEAGGNPLALSELALAWSALPPGTVIADRVPLTARLTSLFAERLEHLPAPTVDLLLVAALDGGHFGPEVFEAARSLAGTDLPDDATEQAIAARLLRRQGGRLRCHHPLVPAALVDAAEPARRRRAHAALAGAHTDPDRIAWHRAAAADGPDDEIAKALLGAAERSRWRGATAEAVAALERAAELTGDTAEAGAHLVRAAEVAVELGQPDVVRRLLDLAEPLDLRPLDRARAQWRRSLLDGGAWRDANQVRTMVRLAVEHAHRGDPDAALDALVTIAMTGWWTNFDAERRYLVRAAVLELDIPADDPRRLAVLGTSAPAACGAEVLGHLRSVDLSAHDPPALALLAAVSNLLGNLDLAADALEVGIHGARRQGRLNTLSSLLANRATNAWQRGEWAAASRAALEATRLGDEVGRPANAAVGALASALLTAMHGEVDDALRTATEVERRFRPLGAEPILGLVAHVRGLAALVGGDAEAACDQLLGLFDPAAGDVPTMLRLSALDVALDAAAAADRRADGRRLVDHAAALAAEIDSPRLRELAAYGDAILSEPQDHDADRRFGTARALIRPSSPLAAKLDLAHGVRLRRTARAAAARAPLRAARDAFDALGATVLAERARSELRAAGEASSAPVPGAAQLLTPQELEIATLAAAGLTNREIGRQLFLSHRTVGSHLYRAFPKLGITSRSQLRTALGPN
jgi:DNA-binding CsgD family transcriptional regulator